jgi:hypothetical protein
MAFLTPPSKKDFFSSSTPPFLFLFFKRENKIELLLKVCDTPLMHHKL